jgi:hypothetical protein
MQSRDNSTKSAIEVEIIREYSDGLRPDRRITLESDCAILVGRSQTFPVDLVNVSGVTALDQAILAIAPKNEELAAHEADFLGRRLALLDHAGDLFGELFVIPSGVDRLRFHRPTFRQQHFPGSTRSRCHSGGDRGGQHTGPNCLKALALGGEAWKQRAAWLPCR